MAVRLKRPAHHAKGLGQGAVDDVDSMHQPIALSHAGAAGGSEPGEPDGADVPDAGAVEPE